MDDEDSLPFYWHRSKITEQPLTYTTGELRDSIKYWRQNAVTKELCLHFSFEELEEIAEVNDLIPLWNAIASNAFLGNVIMKGQRGIPFASLPLKHFLEAIDRNNSSIEKLRLADLAVHIDSLSTLLRNTTSVTHLQLRYVKVEQTLDPAQAARNLSTSIVQNNIIQVLECYQMQSLYQEAILTGLAKNKRVYELQSMLTR